MEIFQLALDFILNMDTHLNHLVTVLGPWVYLLLFLIVFCETGLVVTPFLPGDSLLFALGALTAVDNAYLQLWPLSILLMVAGILGDATNYHIGAYIGPKVFKSHSSRWLKTSHLVKTQNFYNKHGGKTIILARFMPIIRTFAPFVAGIGKMKYGSFFVYNVVGAILWVNSFLLAGHFFGNIPTVKDNFHIVIFAIIIISFMPVVIEYWRSKKA